MSLGVQSIVGTRCWRRVQHLYFSVGQEPVLFNISIRSNIAYGMEPVDATFECIEEAAKRANAHEVCGVGGGDCRLFIFFCFSVYNQFAPRFVFAIYCRSRLFTVLTIKLARALI